MSTATRNGKAAPGPIRLGLVLAPGTMTRIGRTIHHLVIGLIDAPMWLTIVAPESEDLTGLPEPPVSVIRYRTPRWGRLGRRTVEIIAGHFQRQGIECIHGLDDVAHALTRKVSDMGGWPYLQSVLQLKQFGRGALPGRSGCGVIAPSLALREAVLAAKAAPPEAVHLVRPGVRTAKQPACFARADASAAIVAAGAMRDFAAFGTVLDAFATLRAEGYDCLLWMLGNGPAESRLRARVKDLKLTRDVTFVDALPQKRLPGVFQATDIMIYPTTTGALEVEILEAMAAGAAVLVGRRVVGDFVIDGDTAMEYGPRQGARLIDRLKALLDDRDRAVDLARRGHDHVRRHHGPADMIAALVELYSAYALPRKTTAS